MEWDLQYGTILEPWGSKQGRREMTERCDLISSAGGQGWYCQTHHWHIGHLGRCPKIDNPYVLKQKLIYIGGSMRNREAVRAAYLAITNAGHKAFCDWIMPGEATDEKWQEFEQSIGRSYAEAIQGPHADDVFNFDKTWLDNSDGFVLVLPAGRSAHIELGYMVGKGKPAFILMQEEPERWDLMYRFATGIVRSHEELIQELGKAFSQK